MHPPLQPFIPLTPPFGLTPGSLLLSRHPLADETPCRRQQRPAQGRPEYSPEGVPLHFTSQRLRSG